MGQLLSILFQFLRRNLLMFALIVLVLAAAPWVQREWGHIQRIVGELPALRESVQVVSENQAALADDVARRIGQLSGASIGGLDAEIRRLDAEIAALRQEAAGEGILSAAVAGKDALAARLQQQAMRELRIATRRQAREHLATVRAYAVVMLDRRAAYARLEQLRLAHVSAYQAYLRAHREAVRFRADAGWLARIPGTPHYQQLKQREEAASRLLAANNQAHRDFLAQRTIVERLPAPGSAAVFRVDAQRLADTTAALRAQLAQAEHLARHNRLWQAYQAVLPVLPAALGVLAGWWLLPAALRTLFYFVLAPLAARRPPIVIDARVRHASSLPPEQPDADHALISAVSRRVILAPGDEMLIRPAYCQSIPVGVGASTKLLFDWRHPLTSIAAHLWMLTRLRTSTVAQVVVSSTSDPLDDVALVEIPAGEALVLQPRALVGVICKAEAAPAIRSHWRIGTLHAWLTLQLRYLAFEGPATLIVRGCRGVRMERAAAGRTIGQDATLGFSAHARYATVRAEPFLPYLRGRQPLFHDSFEGSTAWFLYEEVPRNAQASRRRCNPLEVLLDAGLKAFGI